MEKQKESFSKEYLTHPRDYHAYRWYKPLLVALLTMIFFFIFTMLLVAIGSHAAGPGNDLMARVMGGYDTFDVYTGPGALVTLGNVAAMLPALFLAACIVRDRPFSSYGSAGGGWRMKVFWKCFAVALIVCAIPILVQFFLKHPSPSAVRFTAVGFLLCTILAPIQCIAEEYIFRGLFFQTVGSWFKSLIIALLVSAALFGSSHPYNIYGVAEVTLFGLFMCIMAVLCKGLEASSAVHIVNNMTLFYLGGFGYETVSKDSDLESLLTSAAINTVYLLVLFFVGKKRGWFEQTKKDDVTPFNAKYDAKHPVS